MRRIVEREIKRIGVISCAAVFMVIYAIVGLIIGIIVALIGAAIPGMPTIFRGVAILVGLINGTFLGFVGGAIFAILYNVAARYVKGIKVEY